MARIEMYDVMGRTIADLPLSPDELMNFPLDQVNSGLYLINVHVNDEFATQKKVVVVK